jgi:hypothetical protein
MPAMYEVSGCLNQCFVNPLGLRRHDRKACIVSPMSWSIPSTAAATMVPRTSSQTPAKDYPLTRPRQCRTDETNFP